MPFVGIGVGIGRQRFAQGGIFAAYAARVAADGGVTEAGACVNAVSGISLNSSLLLVPSGYKSGVVYSEIPTDGDGDLTFTRASSATRVNSDGEIEVVGSGVPRLDYSQGSCPALLLEPQRTNNFTQSESFANYYINRATATDLGTPSIFSSGSIARFTATNFAAYFGKVTGGITSGITYSVSGFFDLSEGIYAGISDTTNYRIFNLLTASVVGSGGGSLTISCKSTQIGSSNYYRIAFTFTATTTGNHFFVIGKSDGTVNTTNETVAAGYFQRENSASYATSYIPTTSATVTRLADACSKTGISSLIGQTEGAFMIDVDLKSRENYTYFLINNTNSNYIGIGFNYNTIVLEVVYASTVQCSITSGNSATGQLKIAGAYANNDFVLYINGTQVGTDTSGSVPATNKVDLYYNATNIIQYNEVLLFPTRLSNAELASLTTL
jgi:hypothetical protein